MGQAAKFLQERYHIFGHGNHMYLDPIHPETPYLDLNICFPSLQPADGC